MEMQITVVQAPPLAAAPPVDFVLEAPAGASGARVARALLSRWPHADFSVGGRELATLTVGEGGLVNGAVVVAGRRPPVRAPGLPPLMLVALAGPDAGCVHPLPRGTFMLGRGAVPLPVDDPGMSRRQAVLTVGSRGVELDAEPGAAPCKVDGAAVRHVVLRTGAIISFGSSLLQLTFTASPALALTEAADPSAPDPNGPLVVRRPSQSSRAKAAGLLIAGLPLVLGLGLAFFTHQWMYAAFASMPAVVAAVAAAGGRRRRRQFRMDLAAALHTDKSRRWRAAPSPGQLICNPAAANQPTAGSGKPGLRLGTATLAANVVLEPADPSFKPPMIAQLPLCVDLTPGTVSTVRAGTQQCHSLARALLMHLDHAGLPCYVSGFDPSLMLAARLLPQTLPGSGTAGAGTGREAGGGSVVLIGPGADPSRLRQANPADCLIRFREGTDGDDPAQELSGWSAAIEPGCNVLERGGDTVVFEPDLCSAASFDRYARRRARQPAANDHKLPLGCSLSELQPMDAKSVASVWEQPARTAGLLCTFGRFPDGPAVLDLEKDGPHLLIAGTTGSGKSELLRTLVTSLACRYKPELLGLVLLDFKGGAGLSPFAGLPHCAGLVTDLDGYGLQRAMMSLGAEVRRRELLLQAHSVPDFAAYQADLQDTPPLPQLLIVVDEFRIMVEQFPESMTALMKIASVGRSLGIHIVMATQRPQGAISADIRANVTSSICLRVQSGMDSTDVLGSPVAARIPVELPGRGYLRRGPAEPVLFQTAIAAAPEDSSGGPVLLWALDTTGQYSHTTPVRVPEGEAADEGGAAGAAARSRAASDPQAVTEMIADVAARAGSRPPAPVLAAPLPQTLRPADLPARSVEIAVGLLDIPQRQTIAPLYWSPAVHGHLAVLGQSAGSSGQALLGIAGQALRYPPPGSPARALYVLDGDDSLSPLSAKVDGSRGPAGAAAAAAGAYLRPRDLRTVVHLVRELLAGADMKLRSGDPRGESPAECTAQSGQPALLVVSAWGSWQSAIRSSPWPWLEESLGDLVRDGPALDLRVLISGARELSAARFISAIPSRIHVTSGATPELLSMWPRMPGQEEVPGRGYASGAIANSCAAVDGPPFGFAVQLAVAAGLPAAEREPAAPAGNPPGWPLPQLRAEPLPRLLPCTAISGAPAAGSLVLGVEDGSLSPSSVELAAGSVLIAAGARGSGKSSLLAVLPQLNSPAERSAGRGSNTIQWVRPDNAAGQRFWSRVAYAFPASTRERIVLLVDNAEALSTEELDALRRLLSSGAAAVITSANAPHSLGRLALVPEARLRGVVLAPQRPQDGDFFGVRLDCYGHAPPGRAAVVVQGTTTWVQIPFPDAPAVTPPAHRHRAE